ncbi:hypothetical protein Sste5344_002900 [Sporothrix stenoceras]
MAAPLANAALSVLPVNLEDLETLSRIQAVATAPTAPVHAVIYPHGSTDKVLAIDTATKQRSFNQPELYYRKVVEKREGQQEGDGEIVAFARWYIWSQGRNDDGWFKPYVFKADEGFAPGEVNVAAASEYYGKADVMKKKHIQDIPHLYISLLATRPEWQGRGCGRLLMNEAFRMAKEHGLNDVYLISVAASRSFYERCGFETVDTLTLNLTALAGVGGEKPDEWVDTYLLRATTPP